MVRTGFVKLSGKKEQKMSGVVDLFLQYVKVDTCSDPESEASPSTAKQHDLARLLVAQLADMGAEEITYDEEHCYVYASIPASAGCEDAPVLGFISHMDTSPAISGANVNPRIVEKYDGGDILLNENLKVFLSPAQFPGLHKYKGKDLIVTDGTTLLGTDDKAGIAEIMSMAGTLLSDPSRRHGKIRIGFTSDEEIGQGADHFNVKLFGAKFAYTVDGGALGELEYENFNAAGAKLLIHGNSIHPGSAKGKMKNAILIAQEFQSMLPAGQNPMYTEGYEGFYHLDNIRGTVEELKADYIIRDHDRGLFEDKKRLFLEVVDFLNRKYGEGTVTVELKDSYYNMKDIISQHMHLVDNASAAMRELGVEPLIAPIRGGTDGARLSFLGLPCPNLCVGGENCHGKYEFACVQDMETITELLMKIAEKYAG